MLLFFWTGPTLRVVVSNKKERARMTIDRERTEAARDYWHARAEHAAAMARHFQVCWEEENEDARQALIQAGAEDGERLWVDYKAARDRYDTMLNLGPLAGFDDDQPRL